MKSIFKIPMLIVSLLLIGILSSYKTSEPKVSLSKAEIQSLLFMLEEEKMAFDVYTLMDEKWGTMQFNHIKQSEVMHMNAVKNILDQNNVKYSLLEQGKFNDKNLQKLYNELIAQGNKSEVEALKAGAKIEDVDIYDLIRLKKETQNADIIKAYNFLECGSRNHLRAFTRGLNRLNEFYKPEFISQKEYETIINGQQERCGQEFGMGQGQGQMKGQGLGMRHGKGQMNGMNCGGTGQNAKECPMNQQQQGQYGKQAECDAEPQPCCKM